MKTFWKKWKNTQTVSKNDDWKTLSKITCTSSCPHIQNHDRWREILTYGKATRNNSAKYSLKFSYYYWFKSVVRELRAKRFEILLRHLHSECVIRISSSSTLMWGKGYDPSSVLKMGLSERFFIVCVGRNMCQWSVFQDNFNLNNNGIQSIKSYRW